MLKLRMQRGLSREQLGELAGVSGKQIGLIERGVARHSRAGTLANIAKALEADPLDVFPIERRMR